MTITEPRTTPDELDIRTSALPARQVHTPDGVRMFPAVTHTQEPDDKQVKTKAGKAFGRQFRSEGIGMAADVAHLALMSLYGPLTASEMLRRADKGEFVFGEKVAFEGANGERWRTQIDVTADDSREPGFYVLQFAGLRQGGKRVSG